MSILARLMSLTTSHGLHNRITNELLFAYPSLKPICNSAVVAVIHFRVTPAPPHFQHHSSFMRCSPILFMYCLALKLNPHLSAATCFSPPFSLWVGPQPTYVAQVKQVHQVPCCDSFCCHLDDNYDFRCRCNHCNCSLAHQSSCALLSVTRSGLCNSKT
jgi:hypothetical protein